MPKQSSDGGRRAARTRAAIVEAFVRLVFERRYDAIRIADIVTQAGVGKSTFYEHFRSKSDVLLSAMNPALLALSTAASERAARPYVRDMMGHLWERRSTGRPILSSTTVPIMQRRLAEMILPHVKRSNVSTEAPMLTATGIAAAQLAMLKCWLTGEVGCSVEGLTDRMIACSRITASRVH